MREEIEIVLEWNDDTLETKMSVDGKMYVDYSQAHRLLVDLLKEIDKFEKKCKDR